MDLIFWEIQLLTALLGFGQISISTFDFSIFTEFTKMSEGNSHNLWKTKKGKYSDKYISPKFVLSMLTDSNQAFL